MKIERDDLWFCTDCTLAAVNGDYSGIDYYLSGANAARRVAEVRAGLEKFGPHLVAHFDGETGEGIEEFSHRACDCCGSTLAGFRTRFATLAPEPYNPPAHERGILAHRPAPRTLVDILPASMQAPARDS